MPGDERKAGARALVGRRRRLLQVAGGPVGNAVAALARREADARSVVAASRRRLPLGRVLRRDDGAALLGFSRDGGYLMFVSWWEADVDIQWRRAAFTAPSDQDGDAERLSGRTVYSLRVGDSPRSSAPPLGSPSLSGSFVRVWQSVDSALVVAIATDRHVASASDSSQLYQLSLAPSPAFDGGLAASVACLRFDYSVQSPAQTMEPWQLLELSRGRDAAAPNVYHLLLNLGSAVTVLVFHIMQEAAGSEETTQRWSLPYAGVAPRGLGISHFAQNEWYYSPEFPIEFHKERVVRDTSAGRGSGRTAVEVECLAQQMLDVEKFLQKFLDSFAQLRRFYLVDYDLRLVRVIASEKTLFMSCVMQLTSLGGHEPAPDSGAPSARRNSSRADHHAQRVALFFCVDLFTGAHHIIRALRVPLANPLRHFSARIARSFLADINARVPPDARPASWDNAAVMREQSLRVLHNPLYPISIHLP